VQRRVPPLNGLRAFEAAARNESFTRAAEELSVTQGAVSQRVKALEDRLGVKLFMREARGLKLTSAGREYLEVVRDALDRIAIGTDRLLDKQNSGRLTISTSPNFAAKWLVHRLSRFAELHPTIDLRINASMQHIDFSQEEIDVAVRHSDGNEPGLHVTMLYKEELFPVCSPRLLSGKNALTQPGDLVHHTLLHLDNRRDWSKWLEAASVTGVDLSRGPVLNQASMAIDAAVDGAGIALARTGLAARDLLAGRLVRPFTLSLSVDYAYWIVCPKASARLPKIELIRAWLLDEAAEDTRQLSELAPPLISL
jgi:LysR family glycine cleavage system transcriptional activator